MSFSLIVKTADALAAEARAAARARLATAVEAHVEAQARALGYSGAAQLASYAASTVPDWAAEARAFVAWRDAVWLAVQAEGADTAQPLARPEDILARLPPWRG